METDHDLTSARIYFHKRVNKYMYRPIYTCMKRPPNIQRDRNRLASVNGRNLTIQHCTRTGRDSVRHIHQQQVLVNSESETIQMRNRYLNQCWKGLLRMYIMMYAISRIHNGHKVVVCFRHATPSHYHHYAWLLACVEHKKCLPGISCRERV